MPLRSGLMFGGCGPTSGRVLGALRGVEMSLTKTD